MKLIIKALLAVFVVFILLRSCGPFLRGPNPLLGQLAPDFTLLTLSGRSESMNSVRAGQPAILFFWTTWCPHCRSQLAALNGQRADIEGQGIKVILVDVGEDSRKVKAYVDSENISYDSFLDKDGIVSEKYNIIGFPTFFLLSREGRVLSEEHALLPDYKEVLLEPGP
ncbi:MAG: TlpA family protein disulfide reductase [Candidatus Omnitrophica bacterium]|nr:TlpA family protein disulfide reductase [Candidatus Omnitrophota bacterium]